jgi:hypothetical protein
MLGAQLAQNLYREIEGLKEQLEKVTNDHRSLQQDFVEMELDYKQEKEEMMAKIDYLTELAGCGVPDDWVDDQGNEGDNCKAINLWNKWQEKWVREYQRDGDQKPKCWWELADMIDQRYDQLEEAHQSDFQNAQKRDHETLAAVRESQKEIDALTKKNLEMANQIHALETACSANFSASENRERMYRTQISQLETAAGVAAVAMGNLSKEVTQLKEELDRYKNSSTQENEGHWFKKYTQTSARTDELEKEVWEYQVQINDMAQKLENSDRDYRAQIDDSIIKTRDLKNKNYDMEYTLKEILRIVSEATKTDEGKDE